MKRKILFVDDDQLRNGSTVSLEYLVRGFNERDYEVFLLTWKVNDNVKSILKHYSHLIDGRRWYAPTISLAVCFTFRESPFSIRGLKNIIKDIIKLFGGAFIAYRCIKNVKPDIVYLNEYRVLQAAIVAKLLKIPTMTHIRSRFWEERFFIRRSLLAKSLLKYCDALIAITPQEKLQFQPYRKGGRDHIYVIREFCPQYIIDSTAVESLRKQIGLSKERTIVTMLGGIRYLKGTHLFLHAAEIVSQELSEPMFLLLGVHEKVFDGEDKEYYDNCMRIIKKLEQRGSIKVFGNVLNPLEYIAISDIIVSPYVEEHFSRPVIEAWGLKKPVIAVKTKYMLDTIDDGIDGILVEKDNPSELAQKILLLLRDPIKRKKLGEEGYKKVRALYDYENNMNTIVNIANSLLNSRLKCNDE